MTDQTKQKEVKRIKNYSAAYLLNELKLSDNGFSLDLEIAEQVLVKRVKIGNLARKYKIPIDQVINNYNCALKKLEKEADILSETNLADMVTSVRIKPWLRRNKIVTLGQLLSLSEVECRLKGATQLHLGEIQELKDEYYNNQ